MTYTCANILWTIRTREDLFGAGSETMENTHRQSLDDRDLHGRAVLGVDIRFVRLDDDVCGFLNRLADTRSTTVSDLMNEILRQYLHSSRLSDQTEGGAASNGQ